MAREAKIKGRHLRYRRTAIALAAASALIGGCSIDIDSDAIDLEEIGGHFLSEGGRGEILLSEDHSYTFSEVPESVLEDRGVGTPATIPEDGPLISCSGSWEAVERNDGSESFIRLSPDAGSCNGEQLWVDSLDRVYFALGDPDQDSSKYAFTRQ
ncbi:hypothetical protein Slu03_13370 [Sediminihabitans luteus]|nr:hypothetical protein Slu03_13370 [Sediminihabitans luteus]